MSPHEEYILDHMLVEARVMMMEGSPLELDPSQFSDCVTSLIGRLRETEKDAARYRWLRSCTTVESKKFVSDSGGWIVGLGVLDGMIDQAMKEKGDD